ncbi:MAG: ABC transporter substrate-binding protein [Actinobacteria bacterium]|nr:ABC transporter substrate-binding protein [Actinomycetota bacterium]
MAEDWRDTADRHALTRRSLLIAGAGGVGALALAACGASSGTPTQTGGSSPAPTGKPKPGGVLRVGLGGGSPSENFDAAFVNGPAATTRDQVFYENLIWMNGTLGLENALIEEITPNKSLDSWTIKLKPEVEFHNGKTLVADDVVFTMERILDPKVGATASGQYINSLAGMKKIDAQTVQFDLHYPNVSFPQLLSDVTYMVPVGYDPKNPVSTGPWKFKSFTPGQQTVLERFENYWGTKALAEELIMVELPDDTARVNAMLSGQVDAIDQVPFVQVSQLEGTGNISIVASETGAFNPITMRVDLAPYNDVRVRQAIKLLMSREQAITSALNGQGTPASDYFGRFAEGFKGGPQREQNIEEAQSLLKQAGRENETFELVTSPISAGIVQACEVLAANAKTAGVKLNTKLVEPSTYYGRYTKWPFSIDYWPGLPYLVTASIANGPKSSVVNTTHFNDPQFNSLFFQACKQPDKGKQEEIIQEMHKIEFERGGFLVWSFQNTVDAYSNKLAGYNPVDHTGWGLSRCRLDKLGFV